MLRALIHILLALYQPYNTRQHLLLLRKGIGRSRGHYISDHIFLHLSFVLLHGSLLQQHLLTTYSYYRNRTKTFYPFI